MEPVFKPPRRPNVFDLEKVTGVSRGTISRAFNNSTTIKAATREMVLKKAAEIGYSPHPGARTMKFGRTAHWGLLMPHLKNPWYAELTEALDREARQKETMLLLGLTHYDAALESKFVRYWASGEADGIIIDSTDSSANYDIYAKIQARGFPLVFIHGSPKGEFDFVHGTGVEEYERLLKHIYDAGHRRIGFVSKGYKHVRDTIAFIAYADFLKSHGIQIREDYLHFADHEELAGEEAWRKWRHWEDRPTAVVCTADIIACSLIREVRAEGKRFPQDLSVVGLGDIPEAARLGLTTIQSDPRSFAKATFELLQRPRLGPHPLLETRTISSRLILRDSVVPPG